LQCVASCSADRNGSGSWIRGVRTISVSNLRCFPSPRWRVPFSESCRCAGANRETLRHFLIGSPSVFTLQAPARSETISNAPVVFRCRNPVMKIVAVSMSKRQCTASCACFLERLIVLPHARFGGIDLPVNNPLVVADGCRDRLLQTNAGNAALRGNNRSRFPRPGSPRSQDQIPSFVFRSNPPHLPRNKHALVLHRPEQNPFRSPPSRGPIPKLLIVIPLAVLRHDQIRAPHRHPGPPREHADVFLKFDQAELFAEIPQSAVRSRGGPS